MMMTFSMHECEYLENVTAVFFVITIIFLIFAK